MSSKRASCRFLDGSRTTKNTTRSRFIKSMYCATLACPHFNVVARNTDCSCVIIIQLLSDYLECFLCLAAVLKEKHPKPHYHDFECKGTYKKRSPPEVSPRGKFHFSSFFFTIRIFLVAPKLTQRGVFAPVSNLPHGKKQGACHRLYIRIFSFRESLKQTLSHAQFYFGLYWLA